ncbi:DUF2303 family protein [Phycicoccus sp.]|uniref:DUF2303 family protein n=1 Tax=Phycicoccus sp. TaxID=1902410 RepID=UPI002C1311FE|nr:DUF2303 family protein [Phycicoccus sp.]HMM95285.1 DUF2303 family protein [Phycicoccus sp.]
MSTKTHAADEFESELVGQSNVTDVAALAFMAKEPTIADPQDYGKPHAFVVPAGCELVIDDFADRKPRPDRGTPGTRVVRDEKDLIKLAEDLGEHPVVYADPVTQSVVCVLNDDVDEATPGWRDQRVQLGLVETDEWKAWKSANNNLMTQADFAEFIEDWRRTIVNPDDATMLEIAQTLHATSHVRAKSARRLRDGQRKIEWDEDTTTTAGEDGKVEIPEVFEIAVVPWKGRDVTPLRMTARLRIRLNGGNVMLGFKLNDVDARMEEAFNSLLDPVRDKLTVVSGTP